MNIKNKKNPHMVRLMLACLGFGFLGSVVLATDIGGLINDGETLKFGISTQRLKVHRDGDDYLYSRYTVPGNHATDWTAGDQVMSRAQMNDLIESQSFVLDTSVGTNEDENNGKTSNEDWWE